jgi:hypothetical protein
MLKFPPEFQHNAKDSSPTWVKTVKQLSVLILTLMLLNSCNCVETHLTKEEKEWFSVYKKGQNLVFKSNKGNLDTILIAEKTETHNNKDCNYFGIGSTQPHVMFITLKPKICHNESYCDGEMFISKDQVDEKCFPSFSFLGLLEKSELKNTTPKPQRIKLNSTNKTYSQVYCFEEGINADNYGNNYLKSFYWDKKEGLIRYEAHDGEVFELLKK